MDLATRAAAPRTEHAGAMVRRQRERPLQLRALEVLCPVTLHDAKRARMRGERGRVGNDPVDHEPFAPAEGVEPALRHAPLECRARLLYLDSRGRQRA